MFLLSRLDVEVENVDPLLAHLDPGPVQVVAQGLDSPVLGQTRERQAPTRVGVEGLLGAESTEFDLGLQPGLVEHSEVHLPLFQSELQVLLLPLAIQPSHVPGHHVQFHPGLVLQDSVTFHSLISRRLDSGCVGLCHFHHSIHLVSLGLTRLFLRFLVL